MFDSRVFQEAVDKLRKSGSWTLLCHENPDGDTLGSALALASVGKRMGKTVRVCSKDPIPDVFSFFPCAGELVTGRRAEPEELSGSLLVIVDTSTERRSLENLSQLTSICDSLNIDHHGDNTLFAATNLIDSSASATAEIMTKLIEALAVGITPEEASALYTALATDNGNFRYNSTSPESHLIAARLLAAGAKPSEIDDRINENMTPAILRLWGRALTGTELFSDGRCAIFSLGADAIEEACADTNALDGLVNMLMRIKGVKAAFFLTERADGCKLSIRSRGGLSAREIAALFGGGGHVNAAGAKIAGSLGDVIERVKEEAAEYVRMRDTSGR